MRKVKTTLADAYPELAAQWHPTRNGSLTPETIPVHSTQKAWWIYPYDDPDTGQHFDFEWQAVVNDRVYHSGCPFLNGRRVWPGFNDLATKNPELAAQWHPTRNGSLTPGSVTVQSHLKAWWILPYDDPDTGQHFDFEWQAEVRNRVNGNGCPFLSGRQVWPGFNDLATKNPELAAQWHPTRNGSLTPSEVSYSSNRYVWWQYTYDDPATGEHHVLEWIANVESRMREKALFPFLSPRRVWPGYNDLETQYPDIASEWDYNKNRCKTPSQVSGKSNFKAWWKCPVCGHSWRATISGRTSLGTKCPVRFKKHPPYAD